jgi:N-ethylmaleimide reductase
MATYYRQRASNGGLIVAEATQVLPSGQGFPNSAGITTRDHVKAWRSVTEAVHGEGGIIYLQLWHAGRLSHSSLQPFQGLPIGPSEIAAEGICFNSLWQPVDFEAPRAMETNEISGLVEAFKSAAQNALDAGFDGVEIHAGGGLIEQFLLRSSNCRQDRYGGSFTNRARLLMEIVEAVKGICGGDRTGVRLSPYSKDQGCDGESTDFYSYIIGCIAALKVSYLHLVRARHEASQSASERFMDVDVRSLWPGFIIWAGGFSPTSAETAVRDGIADAVAFGRKFISNPDLPHRVQLGGPLNSYDSHTFYGGGKLGYTDYPTLNSFLL